MSDQALLTTPRPCAPPPPLLRPGRFLAGLLALLMTGLAVWMLWDLTLRKTTKYPCEHAFHHGIDSPVLAVELASDGPDLGTALSPACRDQLAYVPMQDQPQLQTMLQSRARTAIRRDTDADCFFIPLYTSFVWSFGALFSKRVSSRAVILLGIVMIATAGADYAENFAMFRALREGPSDWIAQQICWPSRFKWALLGLSLLLTAWILSRSANPIYCIATKRLFAIGYLLSGALILVGLGLPTLIGLGMKCFSLLLIFQIFALLGPFVAGWLPPTLPKYEDDFCERKRQRKVDLAVHP